MTDPKIPTTNKIREIKPEENKIIYEDFTEVDYNTFENTMERHFDHRIAGETLSPFDMERFMKRGSSKNLKQLIDGKKAEGFLEASIGKKESPAWVKYVVVGVVICVILVVVFVVLGKLGIIQM